MSTSKSLQVPSKCAGSMCAGFATATTLSNTDWIPREMMKLFASSLVLVARKPMTLPLDAVILSWQKGLFRSFLCFLG